MSARKTTSKLVRQCVSSKHPQHVNAERQSFQRKEGLGVTQSNAARLRICVCCRANYAGLDLPQVRAIINKAGLGDEKRRKLLHMAGRSPELWHGCLPEDIVHVLEIQLEAEESGDLGELSSLWS